MNKVRTLHRIYIHRGDTESHTCWRLDQTLLCNLIKQFNINVENIFLNSDNHKKQFYNCLEHINRKLHVRNPIPTLKSIDNPYLVLVVDKDRAECLSTQYHSVFNVNTNINLPKFPTNINISISMFPINK